MYYYTLDLPGGHSVHPCFPLEVELENVPTGQGRKVWKRWSVRLSGFRLNPEAMRADIKAILAFDDGE